MWSKCGWKYTFYGAEYLHYYFLKYNNNNNKTDKKIINLLENFYFPLFCYYFLGFFRQGNNFKFKIRNKKWFFKIENHNKSVNEYQIVPTTFETGNKLLDVYGHVFETSELKVVATWQRFEETSWRKKLSECWKY